MDKKISIYSFFSGSGFLDLGFESNGFKICFVNEFYKPFLNAYKHSRKIMKIDAPEYGYSDNDITEYLQGRKSEFLKKSVRDKKKESIVGFIGGPPCPDFSVGGKNRGREGNNGKLSGIYTNLINECKPDFFLFENVKGLWRTKKHRNFYEELKKNLQNGGYYTTEKLINSIEYGTPQNRDRIILLGFSKKLLKNLNNKQNGSKCLPEGYFPWGKLIKYPREKIFNLTWPRLSTFIEDSQIPPPKDIPLELTVQYWFDKNKVDNHPNSEHCFTPKAGIKKFAQIAEGDDSRKSFKRLHRWRYSPTACYGNNEVHLHPYKIRRITVAEALAIQSSPSNFTLPDNMTLTDMFKTIGNGVPYLTSRSLSKSIFTFLEVA